MHSYYERLKVGPDATRQQIVGAYRRLAQQAHPDSHPDDPDAPARFREITEAYEVLANPRRRAAYDARQNLGPARRGAAVRVRRLDPTPRAHVSPERATNLYAPSENVTPNGVPLRAGPVWVDHDTHGVRADLEESLWQLLAAFLDPRRRR